MEGAGNTGVAEALPFGLRSGPVPHPGKERDGERKQFRRGARLGQRLMACREGALGISASLEGADPGDPGADGVRSISEAPDARFEPPEAFLFPPFGGKGVGIGTSEVLVVFSEARTDPVAEQGAWPIALLPEKVGKVVPGACGCALALDEPKEKGFGPRPGIVGKSQEVG